MQNLQISQFAQQVVNVSWIRKSLTLISSGTLPWRLIILFPVRHLYYRLLTNPGWLAHQMEKHISFSHFFSSFFFFFLANFQKISFTSRWNPCQSALSAFQVHSHLHLKTHFTARCSGGPCRHYRNGGRLVSSFLHHFTSETGILQEHSGVFFMSTFRAFQPDAEGYFHSALVIRHVSNKT